VKWKFDVFTGNRKGQDKKEARVEFNRSSEKFQTLDLSPI
jgi:hypothetical protein